MPTYLLPLPLIAFKVGCRVKSSMRHLKGALTIKRLPNLVAFAAADNSPYQVPRIRFDMDSFVISVNTYTLITMGNRPDQFKDLTHHKDKNETEVEGIKKELGIKSTGTFNFHIEDDERAVHHIKIPNSNYVPELKICLLSSHHWVQEVQDKCPLPRGTRMEEDDEALLLIWKQGKHRQTIPFHPLTNTPSFRTASALHTYHAFVALHEAAESQYYCWEHDLQMPGCLQLDEECVAEENIHVNIQKKVPSASEGVTSNNLMVEARNLSSERGRESKTEMQTTRMVHSPLTSTPTRGG
jgi:hypothetical protein